MDELKKLDWNCLKDVRKVILLSAIFFIGGTSCKKEDSQMIGLNTQPGGDKLETLADDSLELNAHTIDRDELATSELSQHLLGSYNDPELGVLKAGVYSQLRLSNQNIDLGAPSNLSLDSAILSMVYAGNYARSGAGMDPQTFEVFELSESMDASATYTSGDSIGYSQADQIASVSRTPDLSQPVVIDGDTLGPHLRIPLDQSFGDKILQASGTSDLSDNSNFLNYVKGLRITVDNNFGSGRGSILYHDLLQEYSRVTVYYTHYGTDTTQGQLNLEINDDCALFTTFSADHSNQVDAQLNDTTLGQQELYFQESAGVRPEIRIPGLDDLRDSVEVAVNKAELVLPVKPNSTTSYNPIEQIFVIYIDENGKGNFLADFQLGNDHSGGEYENGEYRLNITRWVQKVISKQQENRPLQLLANRSAINVNRSILNGPQPVSGTSARLELTYTKY